MLRVIDSICEGGKEHNEDYIWHNDTCAVLLDGSTSLIKTDLDARWFVREFIDHFKKAISNSSRLDEAINIAIRETTDSFEAKKTTDHDGDPLEIYPSAAGCFVLQEDDRLYFYNVGDCQIGVFLKDGDCVEFLSGEVEHLDDIVIEEAVHIHETTGQNIDDIMKLPQIRKMLIAHRKLMNQPNGYQILSFGMKEVHEDEITIIPADSVERIVMFSDGFEHMKEQLYDPEQHLADIYQIMRAKENLDENCNETPRLKKSDDASAMVLKVE